MTRKTADRVSATSAEFNGGGTASAPDGPIIALLQSDDDSRDMYAQYFVHLGWRPRAAVTSHEVLTLAPYVDVIVIDIPCAGDLDPYALIRAVKSDLRTKDVPVAVLTAWAQQSCRERAEQAGCDAFLLKPCLPDELLETLVRLLASVQQRSAPIAAGGGQRSFTPSFPAR